MMQTPTSSSLTSDLSTNRITVYGKNGILDAYNDTGGRTHYRVDENGQLQFWRSNASKNTPFGQIKLKPKFKPVQQLFDDGQWPIKGNVDSLIPITGGGALALIDGKLHQLSIDGIASPWKQANNYGPINNAYARNGVVYLVFANGVVSQGIPGNSTPIIPVQSTPLIEQPLQPGDRLFDDKQGKWWKIQDGELARYYPGDHTWVTNAPEGLAGKYSQVSFSEQGYVIGFYQEGDQFVQENLTDGTLISSGSETVDKSLHDAFTFSATAENGQSITLGVGLNNQGVLTGYIEAPGTNDQPAQRLPISFPDGQTIDGIRHLRSGLDGTIYFVKNGNVFRTSVEAGRWVQPTQVYANTLNTHAVDVAVGRDGSTAVLLENGTVIGTNLLEPLLNPETPEGLKVLAADDQLKQIAYDTNGLLWGISKEGILLKFNVGGDVILSSTDAAQESGIAIPGFEQMSTASKDGLIRLVDANGNGYFIGSSIQNIELANALATSKRPNLPGKGQIVQVPGGKWTETFLGLLPGGHTVSNKTDKFATLIFKEKINRKILRSIVEYMAAHVKTPVKKGAKGLWRKIQNAAQSEGPMFKAGGPGKVYQAVKSIIADNTNFQGRKINLTGTNTTVNGIVEENAKIIGEIKQLINYDEMTRPENAEFLRQLKAQVRVSRAIHGYDANDLIFQVAESPVLDKATRQFMYELLELGVAVDKSDKGSILQAKLLHNANQLKRLQEGHQLDASEVAANPITQAYTQGFRSFEEMYNLEKAIKGLSGDLQDPDSELSKAWREVTGVDKTAGQEALVAAIKNKIAALPVGESLTLARNRGVEVSLTGKRIISESASIQPAYAVFYAGPKGHWKVAPSLVMTKKADGSLGLSISYSRDAGGGIGGEFIAGAGIKGVGSASGVLGFGLVGNQVKTATFSTAVGQPDDFINLLTLDSEVFSA